MCSCEKQGGVQNCGGSQPISSLRVFYQTFIGSGKYKNISRFHIRRAKIGHIVSHDLSSNQQQRQAKARLSLFSRENNNPFLH